MMLARAGEVKTYSLNAPPSATTITAQSVDKAVPVSSFAAATPSRVKAAKKAVTVSDYTGNFIATYSSLTTSNGDGGGTVALAQDGDNTVASGFFLGLFKFSMKIDAATGKVTIPWQQVGTFDNKAVYLRAVSLSNNRLSDDATRKELTGRVINKDSIVIDGNWYLTVPDASQYLLAGNNLVLARPNAKMVCNSVDGTTETMDIFAKMTNEDVLSLTNVCGFGRTINLLVNSDSTARATGQIVFKGGDNTPDVKLYTPQKYTITDSTVTVTSAIDVVTGKIADPTDKIIWGTWFISSDNTMYGFYKDATIELPFEIDIPFAPQPAVAGTGTEDDPFVISNTDDWLEVADACMNGNTFTGKFLKVTADITFADSTFAPIGEVDLQFCGTLDGQGHTVTATWAVPKGSRPYKGLICEAGENAVIKNLTSAGDFTFTNSYGAGIVGGANKGVKILNCHNKATIHIPGQDIGFGGIVGRALGDITIDNCSNEGTISYEPATGYDTYIGGILGYNNEDNITITNCTNKGKFAVKDMTTTAIIGGIAGQMSAGTMTNCVNEADLECFKKMGGMIAQSRASDGIHMANCINKGNITVHEVNSISESGAGGMVGDLYAGTVIENCLNMGNIDGNCYVGGIFGNSSSYGGGYIYVKKCVNAGQLKSKFSYIGGMGGYTYDMVVLDSCYNFGDLVAPEANRAGGMIGQMQGDECKISNCVNNGHVSGKFWVGGILGNQAGNYAATGCYNTGKVDANSRAGGINGYSAYYTHVNECFNVGDIASRQNSAINNSLGSWSIGGLGGWVSSHYDNCYNAGTVKGRVNSAGIVGNVYRYASQDIKDYTTSVTNSYNCGLIPGDVDSCGHIIGVHVANNNNVWRTKDWTYLDTIENVFYLDGINPNCIIEKENPQKGLTSAELCKLLPTDKFTSIGDYCYPVLKRFENNPWAKLYAAAIVPKEGNDLVNITENFNIGAPEGVEWTSSYAGLSINGNQAEFTPAPYTGEITLTGVAKDNTADGLPILAGTGVVPPTPTRTIVIKVDYKGNTGVNDVNASKTVKSVLYYNIAGQSSAEPFEGVNIVKTVYTDGTSSVAKVMK